MRLLDRLSVIWHTPELLEEMETLIMSASADYAARLDAASNDLSAELADLRDRIAQAVASGQAADQSWADALEGPVSRLEAMGKNTDDPAAGTDGSVPASDGSVPDSTATPESSGDSSF